MPVGSFLFSVFFRLVQKIRPLDFSGKQRFFLGTCWMFFLMHRRCDPRLFTLCSVSCAAGAKTIEGSGSRVRFELNDVIAFHRPHPDKEAKPYQVRDARVFLEQAGVTP